MARPRSFEAEMVVERAMEEFWTHGYGGTSPAQLAEATGIGKGSLYNTFGSKRQLFDQALARYGEKGAGMVEEFMARPGTTREVIRAFLRETVDSDLARPVRRGCLAANTAAELGGQDPEVTRVLQVIGERLVRVLAARIEQGRREGDVRPGLDARATAEFILNTSVGLRIRARTQGADELYRTIDVALTIL